MSKTPKRGKEERPNPAGGKEDPFQLPRDIARHLRQCVEAHASKAQAAEKNTVQYLWLNLAGKPRAPKSGQVPEVDLNLEDWLDVVDEAASLGVQYMIICLGDSLSSYPDVWKISLWAQYVHEMTVGFHTFCKAVSEMEMNELKALHPKRTWLFVSKESLPAMQSLEQYGIKVCSAEVDESEQAPPCDGPRTMVFVSPKGMLYSCGLVTGNEEFELGHVMERPLEHVLGDKTLPHAVPHGTPHREHGCDGCPPLMVRRILQRQG